MNSIEVSTIIDAEIDGDDTIDIDINTKEVCIREGNQRVRMNHEQFSELVKFYQKFIQAANIIGAE